MGEDLHIAVWPGSLLSDGGSCVAGPDVEWILKPVVGKEGLFTAELDFNRVFEEQSES